MNYVYKSFALLCLSCLVTACSVNGPEKTAAEDITERLVSQDFVFVMTQIDRLDPASTTLDFQSHPDSIDHFAGALKETLQQAGYAIRVQPTAAGEYPVKYNITHNISSTDGNIITYEVSVGDVDMRRSYRPMQGLALQPVATMQLKGVDASTIRLNHQLFDEQEESTDVPLRTAELPQDTPVPSPLAEAPEPVVSSTNTSPLPTADNPVASKPPVIVGQAVISHANKIPMPEETDVPLATASTELTPVDPGAANPSVAFSALNESPKPLVDIAAPSMASLNRRGTALLPELASMEKVNIKDLGESNFAGFLDQYGIVSEAILTFGDDSLRLGDTQKYRIRSLVDQFRADEDVFSVIGCSHGPTRYEHGQEGLAIERANRVKEALLYAGVPQERILEEGCWAEEAFDERMPRRGVVLSLKRSNNS